MTPKEILVKWVDAFTKADLEIIAELNDDNATNHQVANEPVIGKSSIKEMFAKEFQEAEMSCIPEHIFQDGEWAILEWKDPLRGCGFFHIRNDKIVSSLILGKLSFLKLNNLPIE